MNRSSTFLWLLLILIFLVPTTTGRAILDVAGGLFIGLLSLPFILGGIGWISWRILQSRMVKCELCGVTSFSNNNQCPICGSIQKNKSKSEVTISANSAIIDVKAEDAGSDN